MNLYVNGLQLSLLQLQYAGHKYTFKYANKKTAQDCQISFDSILTKPKGTKPKIEWNILHHFTTLIYIV